MNEAETRAEHIDPALAAAAWGVVGVSRIRREYPITLGRIEGHGRRGKAPHRTTHLFLGIKDFGVGEGTAGAGTAGAIQSVKGDRNKATF